uniref:choline-phosphate cytidylyltransferase n=1 Tax=viral metagenome TaxID=1070528 RepID=A0A6C0JQ68_9ZZZZ
MRIYCSGVYDLCHVGHMKFFEYVSNLYPNSTLIVGVHSDNDTESYKRKPIINEKIRYETLKYCKYVDSIIENAPLQTTKEFMITHNIDMVAISEDYINDEKNFFFHQGAFELNKYVYIPRTNYISTTNIISLCKDNK